MKRRQRSRKLRKKAAKAEELGIPMLNEDQFKQLLDTGTVE